MRKPEISIALAAVALALMSTGGIAAGNPKPGKDEPRICRAAVRTTGSRIRTPKLCHTAEEWRQIDEAPLPITLRVNQSQHEGGRRRAE